MISRRIKKAFSGLMIIMLMCVTLFSMTACSGSHLHYRIVYNDLFNQYSVSYRVEQFTDYLYRFASKILTNCANCFGPQKNNPATTFDEDNITMDVINSVDYETIFGITSYSQPVGLVRKSIANMLSTMDNVFYTTDVRNMTMATDILVISNYEIGSRQDLFNKLITFDGENYKPLATMYDLSRACSYVSTEMTMPKGHAFCYFPQGKKDVCFILLGDVSPATYPISSFEEVSYLINSLYSANNVSIIQHDMDTFTISQKDVDTPLNFKSWNYAISSDVFLGKNTGITFGLDIDNRVYNNNDYYANRFVQDENCWRLAMEMAIAMRFGYGNSIAKEEAYHVGQTTEIRNYLNAYKTMDVLYDAINASNPYNQQNAEALYQGYVECAMIYMNSVKPTESVLSEIKEVVLNHVIGYDDKDAESPFFRHYDSIVTEILNVCVEEAPYTMQWDIQPAITSRAEYKSIDGQEMAKDATIPSESEGAGESESAHQSNFLDYSTYFTQSIILYSYFPNIGDIGFDDGSPTISTGVTKYDDIIIGITIPEGSPDEDFVLLSQYCITLMTYVKYKSGNTEYVIKRLYPAVVTKDGPRTYYAEFNMSGSLANQHSILFDGNPVIEPGSNKPSNAFENASGLPIGTVEKDKQVPGFGTYYAGNGSVGENFIQLIFTSPSPDRNLNIMIDYLII